MASLRDYDDLLTADIKIDYSKLDDSFWDEVIKMMKRNDKKFDILEKSLTPTWDDMHRRFDL